MARYKYRVILKGGGSFEIQADDLELESDDDNGEITSYNFKNPIGEVPCVLHPKNIATILEVK